jgi:hypothetical protein
MALRLFVSMKGIDSLSKYPSMQQRVASRVSTWEARRTYDGPLKAPTEKST